MIAPEEVDEGRVRLSVDGQRLTGTLLTPEAPVPGFLFVHGWGGDQDEDLGLAENLARLGCICFTFDLRGHADSDANRDEVTRQNGLDDVTAAYDYLASQPLIDPGAIGVIGTSYGGYLSALLTKTRAVRWLALRVPALYPDQHWDVPKAKLDKAAVRAYRRQRRTPEEDRALAACAAFQGDVLIVQSGRDDRIPPEVIASYQAAFKDVNSFSHRIIPEATHAMRDPADQRLYATLLINWVEEMVRASRRSYR
ncbi:MULTISPECIES: alpha/beta hydrolase family protein [unclassified Brevundimonas]|uniref:alpha/beta hydrolase family protein n=1 Tax=unclassified Brevundimonas TaxID=2622653 RepID=UPI0025BF96D7|nr:MULTISPECIES: alpha/beta fold hydrolase [unclassified Brevundimonas]